MDATFWVGVSFVLFVALLIYKKIPGIINDVLENRIKEIKSKIEDAENLKIESSNLLYKYQYQLEESKKECEEILIRAARLNEEESSLMEEKINTMWKARENNINKKIVQSKNNALKEIKKISTIIAIESAKKIISQTIDKNKLEDIDLANIKESLEGLKKTI